MISIGVSLDFISFSSKQYLSLDDCLSVTECLDFPCDLKEEEQVTCQKLCLSSISNIITSWQSNRSRSVGIRTRAAKPPGSDWVGNVRGGLQEFWHETTPLKNLLHTRQLEIRGLSCKYRSTIHESLQRPFLSEYHFSLIVSRPLSL